jgi:hypothetical protein
MDTFFTSFDTFYSNTLMYTGVFVYQMGDNDQRFQTKIKNCVEEEGRFED